MRGRSLPPGYLRTSRGRSTDVVHGHWDSQVRRVAAALAEDLSTGGALDTAIAIDIDGELVVNIWGGYADKARLCEPKSLLSLCSN